MSCEFQFLLDCKRITLYSASQVSHVLEQLHKVVEALLEYSIRQFIWRVVIHPALYLQETFHTLIGLSSACCICFNALRLLYAFEHLIKTVSICFGLARSEGEVTAQSHIAKIRTINVCNLIFSCVCVNIQCFPVG